jgi:hypothetical protein
VPEFTEQDKQLLRRLKWAANDPTGLEDLILVHTSDHGKPMLALCILYRDAERGVCRVEPVATMITAEEADKLNNPITGKPGLPWVDLGTGQMSLEDQLKRNGGQ